MKKKVEFSPVVLVANPASSVSTNSATISGNATSNKNLIKNIRFEYGIGSLTNKVEVQLDSVKPYESLNQSINIIDLKPNQTYKFRMTATSEGIQYSSNMLQFTTLPDYTIIINYVNNVGSNDADLSGSIVSNSSDITDIEFQYSTDTTFAYKKTAQPSVVYSGTTQTVSAHLSSLKPNTRYYVRIKANFKGAEVYSATTIFNTINTYAINIYNPLITGNNASFTINIKANKDTIRNIAMEYGETREYKNKVDISGEISKGFEKFLSTQLTGLDSATVYFYRIRANMGDEVIYSSENVLKLKKDVVIIPIEYKQLSDSTVQLQGLINSNGVYLNNIKFHYGLTENFGDSVLTTPYSTYSNGTVLAKSTLYNLTPQLKYFAILIASSENSRFSSEPFTFMLLKNGSDNIIDNSGVNIYPNPATNYLIINSINKIDKVELSDFAGRLIMTSKNETKINVSQLQKGVYLIRVHVGDKVITKKIIKN